MVNPWKTYVKLSAVLMGSHGLTKGSLAFLNYPAQLMFKSTKVKSYIIKLGPFLYPRFKKSKILMSWRKQSDFFFLCIVWLYDELLFDILEL